MKISLRISGVSHFCWHLIHSVYCIAVCCVPSHWEMFVVWCQLRPREKEAFNYAEKLKEKYGRHPEVRRIARHRHVPKAIHSAQKELRTIRTSQKKKCVNFSGHFVFDFIHILLKYNFCQHAGSRTLHQQNPPFINWQCRLMQVDLYNGCKTVVVVLCYNTIKCNYESVWSALYATCEVNTKHHMNR